MTYSRNLLLIGALLLSGCSAFDMQGEDPKDYYTKHPIQNTVETRYQSFRVHFMPGEKRLSRDAIDALRDGLHPISPMAVDMAQVSFAPDQMRNEKRKEHLSRLLRGLGYAGRGVSFVPMKSLARDDAQIDITYATVIPARCPDWRRSSTTTYSNTSQGNFGCASTVNLGAQVADPHDLVRGTGATTPDAARGSVVINNYRAGVEPSSSSSSGGTPPDTGSGDGAAAAQ